MYELTCFPAGHLTGSTWAQCVHPDDRERVVAAWMAAVGSGAAYNQRFRYARGATDGSRGYFLMHARAEPLRNADGRVLSWLGFSRDASAELHLAEELASEKQLFLGAINQLPISVMVAEAPSGALKLCNSYTRTLFGYDMLRTSADEYDAYAFRHLDGRAYASHEYPLAHALRGETVKGELMLMTRPDGQERTFRVSAAPVRRGGAQDTTTGAGAQHDSGDIVAVVACAADVTDEIRAHDERMRLRAAQDTAEVRAQLLANVSHELRSPLHGILGMAELLARTDLTREQAEYLAAITDSGKLLLVVINDLLDHEKLRAGRLELEHIPFSPRTVLDQCIALMTEPARKQGVELRLLYSTAPGIARDCAVGDPQRLKQVVMNVLSNAVKFSPGGSVQLAAFIAPASNGPAPVTAAASIGADAPAASPLSDMMAETTEPAAAATSVVAAPPQAVQLHLRLCLQVRDSGIGISAETLPRLFTPWTQADSSTTRRFGGTGLGLAICRQLTTLMGGSISASSEGPGHGTTVTVKVTLPACSSAQAEALQAGNAMRSVTGGPLGGPLGGALPGALAALPELGAAGGGSLEGGCSAAAASPGAHVRARDGSVEGARLVQAAGAPVLVVDDNRVNAMLARRLLSNAGFIDISLAADGQEALDAVAARSMPFAAILMDCQMPVMDGYEAARRIRALPDVAKARTPVIALTASALQADVERSLAAGMSDHVSKPFSGADLAAKVRHWAASWQGWRGTGGAAAAAEAAAVALVTDAAGKPSV